MMSLPSQEEWGPTASEEQHDTQTWKSTRGWTGEGTSGENEETGLDYWEEVTGEGGTVWFYNHTAREFSASLPTYHQAVSQSNADSGLIEDNSEDDWARAGDTQPTTSEGQEDQGWDYGAGIWDDEVEGEVFVPWAMEEQGDMKTSPDVVPVVREALPEPPKEQEEPEFVPDNPAMIREQNLRALLVSLPAKEVNAMIKEATQRATLHLRRTATAQAETRRRDLLRTRAGYRHTRITPPQVATPGLVAFARRSDAVSRVADRGSRRGGGQPDAHGVTNDASDESVDVKNEGKPDRPSNTERDSATRERDVLMGNGLAEVLNVLLKGSKEEVRLTMRRVCLTSQAIGAAGVRKLVPALKKCLIVALFLGNNAIGDQGAGALAEGLRHARGLQDLHLNDNEIMDTGCHRLAVALESLPALTSLDLSHNPFGEEGCRSLANLLSQPGCSLASLAIAGCLDVDPRAWKTIWPPLRADGDDKNKIRWIPARPGDDGAVLLAAAIMSPHGCPLRSFRLANAGLRAIGAKAIATALCANEELEILDLSGNDFSPKTDDVPGESAVESLAFGLQVNTTVHTITLRACGISRNQALKLHSFTGSHKRPQRPQRPTNRTASPERDDQLTWALEKQLGYRASCLRDWLLDAARLKGMRYPRAATIDPHDPTLTAEKRSHARDETTAALDMQDFEENGFGLGRDEKWLSMVQPPLPREIRALRRVIASAINSISSNRYGDAAADGVNIFPRSAETTSIKTLREAIELEEKFRKSWRDHRDTASNTGRTSSSSRKVDGSVVTRASEAAGAEARKSCHTFPEVHVDIEHRPGKLCTPRTDSASSIGPKNVTANAAEVIIASRNPLAITTSAGGEQAFVGNDAETGRLTLSNADLLLVPTRRQGGDPLSTTEDAPSACTHVLVASLSAAVKRGRLWGNFAARKQTELQRKRADINRQCVLLREARVRFEQTVSEGLAKLKSAEQEARAARNEASDAVRRLEPTAGWAQRTAEARRIQATRRANYISDSARSEECVGMKGVSEWKESEEHLSQLTSGLADARKRLKDTQRQLDELSDKECAWNGEAKHFYQTLREQSRSLKLSLADVRTHTKALKQAEITLVALATKSELLYRLAEEEEDLRSLVPAGSGRRALDVQVADAVRIASAASVAIHAALDKRKGAASRVHSIMGQASGEAAEMFWDGLDAPKGEISLAARGRTAATAGRAEEVAGVLGESEPEPSVCFNFTQAGWTVRREGIDTEITKSLLDGIIEDVVTRSARGANQDGELRRANATALTGQGTQPSGQASIWLVNAKSLSHESMATDDPTTSQANAGSASSALRKVHRGGPAAVQTEIAVIPTEKQADILLGSTRADFLPQASVKTTTDDACYSQGAFRDDDTQGYHKAVARAKTPHVKRALALIHDHTAILRMRKREAEDCSGLERASGLPHLTAGAGALRRAARRRDGQKAKRGSILVGAELNDRIALGARIALLCGASEEQDQGDPVLLPGLDERGLTVGQRVQRLQDTKEATRREKQKVYTNYSRTVKRNLRARKRILKAGKSAKNLTRTMDASELASYMQERGIGADTEPNNIDELRCATAEAIRPNTRVRLHATSRWGKNRAKESGLGQNNPGIDNNGRGDVGIGEIALRRIHASEAFVPDIVDTRQRAVPACSSSVE